MREGDGKPRTGANIDWDYISSTAAIMRRDFEAIRVLNVHDVDQLRWSILTYGRVPPPPWVQEPEFNVVHVKHDNRSPGLADEWDNLLSSIGNLAKTNPDHFGGYSVDAFDVITKACNTQTLDDPFLRCWAEIHCLYTTYLDLSVRHRMFRKQVIATLQLTSTQSIDVQKHWCAQWIFKHYPNLTSSQIADGRRELAELCKAITRGRLLPPAPYPKDWFGRMLNKKSGPFETTIDVELTRRFYVDGPNAIRKKVRHPLLTPDTLPPLTREAFQKPR